MGKKKREIETRRDDVPPGVGAAAGVGPEKYHSPPPISPDAGGEFSFPGDMPAATTVTSYTDSAQILARLNKFYDPDVAKWANFVIVNDEIPNSEEGAKGKCQELMASVKSAIDDPDAAVEEFRARHGDVRCDNPVLLFAEIELCKIKRIAGETGLDTKPILKRALTPLVKKLLKMQNIEAVDPGKEDAQLIYLPLLELGFLDPKLNGIVKALSLQGLKKQRFSESFLKTFTRNTIIGGDADKTHGKEIGKIARSKAVDGEDAVVQMIVNKRYTTPSKKPGLEEVLASYDCVVDLACNNPENFEIAYSLMKKSADLDFVKDYETIVSALGEKSPPPLLYHVFQEIVKTKNTEVAVDDEDKWFTKACALQNLFFSLLFDEKYKTSHDDLLYCVSMAIENEKFFDFLHVANRDTEKEGVLFEALIKALDSLNNGEPCALDPDFKADPGAVLKSKPLIRRSTDKIRDLSMKALISFAKYYEDSGANPIKRGIVPEKNILQASDPKIVKFLLANGVRFEKPSTPEGLRKIRESTESIRTSALCSSLFSEDRDGPVRGDAEIAAKRSIEECRQIEERCAGNTKDDLKYKFDLVCKYGMDEDLFEKSLTELAGCEPVDNSPNEIVKLAIDKGRLSSRSVLCVMKNIDRFKDILRDAEVFKEFCLLLEHETKTPPDIVGATSSFFKGSDNEISQAVEQLNKKFKYLDGFLARLDEMEELDLSCVKELRKSADYWKAENDERDGVLNAEMAVINLSLKLNHLDDPTRINNAIIFLFDRFYDENVVTAQANELLSKILTRKPSLPADSIISAIASSGMELKELLGNGFLGEVNWDDGSVDEGFCTTHGSCKFSGPTDRLAVVKYIFETVCDLTDERLVKFLTKISSIYPHISMEEILTGNEGGTFFKDQESAIVAAGKLLAECDATRAERERRDQEIVELNAGRPGPGTSFSSDDEEETKEGSGATADEIAASAQRVADANKAAEAAKALHDEMVKKRDAQLKEIERIGREKRVVEEEGKRRIRELEEKLRRQEAEEELRRQKAEEEEDLQRIRSEFQAKYHEEIKQQEKNRQEMMAQEKKRAEQEKQEKINLRAADHYNSKFKEEEARLRSLTPRDLVALVVQGGDRFGLARQELIDREDRHVRQRENLIKGLAVSGKRALNEMNKVEEQYAEQIKDLSAQIAGLESEMTTQQKAAKKTAEELSALKNSRKQSRKDLTDAKITKLEAELVNTQKKIDALQKANEKLQVNVMDAKSAKSISDKLNKEEVQKMKAAQDKVVTELQGRIAGLEARIKSTVLDGTRTDLVREVAKTAEIEDLEKKHAEEIASRDAQHAAEVRELTDRLESVQDGASKVAEELIAEKTAAQVMTDRLTAQVEAERAAAQVDTDARLAAAEAKIAEPSQEPGQVVVAQLREQLANAVAKNAALERYREEFEALQNVNGGLVEVNGWLNAEVGQLRALNEQILAGVQGAAQQMGGWNAAYPAHGGGHYSPAAPIEVVAHDAVGAQYPSAAMTQGRWQSDPTEATPPPHPTEERIDVAVVEESGGESAPDPNLEGDRGKITDPATFPSDPKASQVQEPHNHSLEGC